MAVDWSLGLCGRGYEKECEEFGDKLLLLECPFGIEGDVEGIVGAEEEARMLFGEVDEDVLERTSEEEDGGRKYF